MNEPLTANGITVQIGARRVLDDLSAVFAPGEVTCIVGPNGAGKSTLMACLAGLRKATRGEARLGQTAVLRMAATARARRIGFLPQSPEIAWPLEAEALVALGRTPFGGGATAADRAAVGMAMAATGCEELAHRPVDTLSGGERARVLIARALAGQPEWLLADEPLTGLDPGHQLDACALFRRLAHEDGRGVVLTLHDLSLALRLADQVLVLAAGRVLTSGPPAIALRPEIIRQAYGVEARVVAGAHGPLLELVGREPS
jgi:iron complex transport system ATP-binding protein